jgi:hypothetical protein
MDYKICVFMWYDDKIKEYADINHEINKNYCEKYGYTLIKSSDRLYPKKTPHWERIPLILANFDNYDYFIWIDADAHFYIDSPPILNIIREYPEKLFIFSGDTDVYKTNYNCIINSGFFIIKKCEKSKSILNKWLTDNELFKSTDLSKPVFGSNKWNDQAVLRLMISKNIENITDNSIIIDYGILQHFNKTHKLKKNYFGLIDKPFIFHSTNGDNMKFEIRVKNSTEYFSTTILNKYNQFLHSNIQLAKPVISNILLCCQNKKMLVFGLGYDSELWYNATNKNTYFIENNQQYIDLNKNINNNNIIYHQYKDITVKSSLNLTDDKINMFKIPQKLLELAPFDIILIDGPSGYDEKCPGRLLPIYWSKKYLSKEGTIIYVDDAIRVLEKKCINKYFIDNKKVYFKDRLGTMKINI